eukprot:2350974-Prorocentrum_lima.AAC.1
MSALYDDAVSLLLEEAYDISGGRLPGIDMDAVFYADDTSLLSSSSRAIQALLQAIQRVGEEY